MAVGNSLFYHAITLYDPYPYCTGIAATVVGVTGYMQFIPHARVPVLQYVSNRFGVSCDISINNFAGRIKSKIFYWLNTLDERFGDMVTVPHDLANQQAAKMSTYGTRNHNNIKSIFARLGRNQNEPRYSETLERHGFARNRIWTLVAEHPSLNHDGNGNRVSVDLIILKPSEHDLKVLATLLSEGYMPNFY
ncbi:unnamed protein product [Miscanthus lutarioriparius]|uniref:Poly(A) RNA polymerase mitochondrial-like central palm domain-containing protein n=1 Tax=Miscanthus lutarioriparius TaxID=422564 RepID=A0A811M5C7_9POAL|nr:unnamed protein product [Miscanthus lutarioriparius]